MGASMSDTVTAVSAQVPQERTVEGLPARGKFFPAMAIVMLVIVVAGFAGSFFLRGLLIKPAVELAPHLYLHGVVLAAWYLWFAGQVFTVATGHTQLHRRLGIGGGALGVGVILTSAVTSVRLWPRFTEIGIELDPHLVFSIVWLNAAFLISFVVLLALGFALRRRSQAHKRSMLLASLSILPPALTRILDWPIWGFGPDAHIPLLCTLAALIIALGVYDLRGRGSVHPVTLAGGALIIVTFMVGGFVMPNTDLGAAVVTGLYEMMR
jgi:hypothetical protein